MYRAITEYEIGEDPSRNLLANMEKYFAESPQSNCGNLKDVFLKVPNETLQSLYPKPDR